jgi:hypothetical protein
MQEGDRQWLNYADRSFSVGVLAGLVHTQRSVSDAPSQHSRLERRVDEFRAIVGMDAQHLVASRRLDINDPLLKARENVSLRAHSDAPVGLEKVVMNVQVDFESFKRGDGDGAGVKAQQSQRHISLIMKYT